MDELDLLTRHRPDAPPPSEQERTAMRAALTDHIAGTTAATDGTVIDLAASPRRNRRTARRAVALAGAAAALVVGLSVAGGSDRAPVQLRDRPATAAEQLRAIAEVVAPYPEAPYSVATRETSTTGGAGEPSTATQEAVLHRTGPDVWVTEARGCRRFCTIGSIPIEDPPFAADADADAVRAGIEGVVQERMDGPEGVTRADVTPEWEAQFRVYYLGALLQHPAPGPVARAEVMRLLAEVPGLTATPGQRDADGRVGTLFRFATTRGDGQTLLLDPADGYVLEAGTLALSDSPFPSVEYEDGTVDLEGEYRLDDGSDTTPPEGPLVYQSRTTVTYGRPTTGTVSAEVAALGDAVAEAAPAADLGEGEGPFCIGGVGPMEADDVFGVAVPDGLNFWYCPQS